MEDDGRAPVRVEDPKHIDDASVSMLMARFSDNPPKYGHQQKIAHVIIFCFWYITTELKIFIFANIFLHGVWTLGTDCSVNVYFGSGKLSGTYRLLSSLYSTYSMYVDS
jgi:hypothetical protein